MLRQEERSDAVPGGLFGDAEVYFGPMTLGLIDGVRLKLLRPDRARGSTAGRRAQPSRSSPQMARKCYLSCRS